MISFMTYEVAHQLQLDINKKVEIVNFTSLRMGYKQLSLYPRKETMQYVNSGKIFDQMYARQLLEDDSMFMNLMYIVQQVYDGKEVVILVTLGNGWDFVLESLQKFLQSRYGFITCLVESPEDYAFVEESPITPMYLYNLELDMARFRNNILSMFGQEAFENSIIDESDYNMEIKYYKS